MSRPSSRCPKCAWVHNGGTFWQCEDCKTIFDTFLTRAHCPGCPKSWADTSCPRCRQWSAHGEWYQ